MNRTSIGIHTPSYAAINVVLALVAAFTPAIVGLVALTALSFSMSIMFPTNFALGVKDLGPYTQTGSLLIVMAIIGGAVLTPVMGLIADVTNSMHMAILVPAFCFVVIVLYALSSVRRGAQFSAAAVPAGAH